MKNVTFKLNEITVKADGLTDKEILENAKQELIKQLKENFPGFSYTVTDEDSLSFETVNCGDIVEGADGEVGIVYGINPKTIEVMYTGGRAVKGHPSLFKKSDKHYLQARTQRMQGWGDTYWIEGFTGHIKNKEGKLTPVVCCKSRGKDYKFYVINGGGRHYKVPEEKLRLIQD